MLRFHRVSVVLIILQVFPPIIDGELRIIMPFGSVADMIQSLWRL